MILVEIDIIATTMVINYINILEKPLLDPMIKG